jgi:hypothetical protein
LSLIQSEKLVSKFAFKLNLSCRYAAGHLERILEGAGEAKAGLCTR